MMKFPSQPQSKQPIKNYHHIIILNCIGRKNFYAAHIYWWTKSILLTWCAFSFYWSSPQQLTLIILTILIPTFSLDWPLIVILRCIPIFHLISMFIFTIVKWLLSADTNWMLIIQIAMFIDWSDRKILESGRGCYEQLKLSSWVWKDCWTSLVIIAACRMSSFVTRYSNLLIFIVYCLERMKRQWFMKLYTSYLSSLSTLFACNLT
jgi:hypothetical protein